MTEGIPGEILLFYIPAAIFLLAYAISKAADSYKSFKEKRGTRSMRIFKRKKKTKAQYRREIDTLAEMLCESRNHEKALSEQLKKSEELKDNFFNMFVQAIGFNGQIKRDQSKKDICITVIERNSEPKKSSNCW